MVINAVIVVVTLRQDDMFVDRFVTLFSYLKIFPSHQDVCNLLAQGILSVLSQ